jgi:TonB family protein
MPRILLVEPESRYVERVGDTLSREGWRVQTVDDKDHALQDAAAETPALVLVNVQVEEGERLLETFARRRGGPGVVAMLPEIEAAHRSQWEARADAVLVKPFTESDLRQAVRRVQLAQNEPPAAPEPVVRKLTSEEIFGDLLAELESSADDGPARRGASVEDEVNRKLEETLSGVLNAPRKPMPAPPAPTVSVRPPQPTPAPSSPPPSLAAPKPAAPPSPAPAAPRPRPPQSDVDALLSRTLGDLGTARPAPRPAAPPRPAAGPAPAAPAAPRPPAPSPDQALRAALAALESSEPLVGPGLPPLGAEPAAPAISSMSTQLLPALDPVLPEGQAFGPYVLLDKIATGGMAEVWKARRSGVEGFQKLVAIKRILPHLTDNTAFIQMFVDEAKLAAQLSHPNIIHIYDLGKIDKDFYIAMEFVEGHNLREILSAARRRGLSVPLGLALTIAARLASALDHAHRKKGFDGRELGLVHRDVSPQNVLISSDGEIKLCDFGIVKAVSKASHTQMGALKGKLQYMSPEQAWGRPVDGRSDLFALGAILFEILTGRRLFAGDNEVTILDAVREGRILRPRDFVPELPEPVEQAILKALARDPDDRYPSAGAMQSALEALIYELKPTPSQEDLAAWIQRLFAEAPAADEVRFANLEPSFPAVTPAPLPAFERSSWSGADARVPARPEPPLADVAPVAATVRIPTISPPAPAAPPVAPASAPALVEAMPAPPNVTADLGTAGGSQKRLLLLAAVLLLAIGGLLVTVLLRRGEKAPPPAEPPAVETEVPPADGSGASGGAVSEGAPVPAGETGAATAPSSDLERIVDQELARREEELRTKLEAEQKRLQKQLAEAQARDKAGREPAAAPAPAVATPAPEPVPAGPTAAELEAEQRRQEEETRARQDQEERLRREEAIRQAEQRQAEEAQKAAAAAAAEPKIKVGQLVTLGPGVVPPSLVSYSKPEYPPQARRLRVEGIVEVAVLVDENGAVVDARVSRGINQNVGLNEAALSAARTARFKPATKEGVRVKVWTTMKFPFKL